MKTVVANLSGSPRRETLQGRRYLAAPMTLIVPGVLAGSRGPLYYPPQEVARDPGVWNNAPLVVYHPEEDGKPVSARNPRQANYHVGRIFNSRIDDSGKLVAEGWFDEEILKNTSPATLAALQQGRKIELSTGLFTDDEPAGEGAAHNGKPYQFIARNYRPDHVAILPNGRGACSIDDGCGVFNATKKEGNEDLPASAYAYVPDPDKPSTWKLRIDDARHVGGAIAAIGKGYRGQKVEIPSTDMPAVKRKIRAAWLKFHPDKDKGDLPRILKTNEEVHTMDREKLIGEVIANDCCLEEEDRETLNSFSDDKLQKMRDRQKQIAKLEQTVNAAKKEFTDELGTEHTWNEEKKVWESKPKEKGDPPPVRNQGGDKNAPQGPKTLEDWMQDAPVEIQGVVRNAMEIQNREKQEIVEQLTANIKDPDAREEQQGRLLQRPLEELRADLSLLPEKPKQTANYAGILGAPSQPTRNEEDFAPFGLPGEYLQTAD